MSLPEMRRPPGERETDATTKNQPPTSIDEDANDEPNFFAEALSGKVRPAPREPSLTHYGCRCCRWSA